MNNQNMLIDRILFAMMKKIVIGKPNPYYKPKVKNGKKGRRELKRNFIFNK